VVVDLKTGEERKLAERAMRIHQAIFVSDGTQVLAAAKEPKEALVLYNASGGAIKSFADAKYPTGWTFLALAPNKRQVLVGGTDKAAYLWDLDTGVQKKRFGNMQGIPEEGRFSTDGNSVYCGGTKPALWYITLDAQTSKGTKRAFNSMVTAVTLSSNLQFLVVATTNSKLSLMLTADDLMRDMLGHQALIKSIGVSSDDRLAVSADENGQVSVWELTEAKEIWRRFFPPAPGRKVVFANGDRSLLITGNGVDIVDWVRE